MTARSSREYVVFIELYSIVMYTQTSTLTDCPCLDCISQVCAHICSPSPTSLLSEPGAVALRTVLSSGFYCRARVRRRVYAPQPKRRKIVPHTGPQPRDGRHLSRYNRRHSVKSLGCTCYFGADDVTRQKSRVYSTPQRQSVGSTSKAEKVPTFTSYLRIRAR